MKRIKLFSFILLAFIFPVINYGPGILLANSLTSLNPDTITPGVSSNPEMATNTDIPAKSAEDLFEDYVDDIYDRLDLRRQGLGKDIFKRAMVGYQNLKYTNRLSASNQTLTIIDFSKSSNHRRLWVVDLKAKKLLHYTWVAHGRGSGFDKAESFSNVNNSFKSSVGFYVTGETYTGKHGLSLKLDGLDAGFNTNARERAIVVHGADYVNKSFIQQHGRAGRSHGCPALPEELSQTIINQIKNKTCLYIDGPVKNYKSVYINKNLAVSRFAAENPTLQAQL